MNEPESSGAAQPPEPERPVSEYVNQIEPIKKYKSRQKLKLIIFIVFILIAAAVAAAVLLKKESTDNKNQTQDGASQAESQGGVFTDTKHYSSNQFRLDFDYPSDWTIKDESGSGILTSTSPELNLPTANGSTAKGQITFTIRANTGSLPEFDAGNGVAVQESEKITYSKPSSAQRGQTYVSFIKFANSAGSDVMDGVYITGDFGYIKDQEVLKTDIQKLDPIINFTFTLCDGSCTQPASVRVDSWNDQGFGGQLKKLLESLVIN